MTTKNTTDKEDRSFDPFSHEHLFHEYNLKITTAEIDQILLLFKYQTVNSIEQLTTYQSLNVFEVPLLNNLKRQVDNILSEHNIRLDNNWAQLYNKDSFHGIHNHYGSVYSGIIYVQGKNPSPTVFHSRNLDNFYNHQFKEHTLLLFPSLVFHEVKPLKEDEERLIISFNTKR